MNLIIDIGNTRVKLALFDANTIEHIESVDSLNISTLDFLFQQAEVQRVISCSVREDQPEIDGWIESRAAYLKFDSNTPIPIGNDYDRPETLGYDRLASAIAANQRYPDRDVLTIDIGTCITYDFVNAAGRFQGGGIAPGMELRFLAMHNFTEKLPLVDLEGVHDAVGLIGRSTEASMQSGVVNGIAAEIDGTIVRYQEDHPELIAILTGGHSTFFESYVKSKIFASPNLVLHGLNTILQYNAQ